MRVGIIAGVESMAALMGDEAAEFKLDGGRMASDGMVKSHALRIKHITNPAQVNFINKRIFDSCSAPHLLDIN